MTRPTERRSSRRVRAARPLRAHLALEADIIHLSACGMAVRLPFPPALGSRQGFSLLVGGHSLDLTGVVRNVAPKDDECDVFDVGIEFQDLSRSQEDLLEQFVAQKLKKP
jgi:hypothetical protein